jgi:hypothetical protein
MCLFVCFIFTYEKYIFSYGNLLKPGRNNSGFATLKDDQASLHKIVFFTNGCTQWQFGRSISIFSFSVEWLIQRPLGGHVWRRDWEYVESSLLPWSRTIFKICLQRMNRAVHPLPICFHACGGTNLISMWLWMATVGWESSVDIATRYWLDSPAIESRRGGEIFRTRLDRPWGPNNGYRVFPGGRAAGAWRWLPTPI